MSCNLVIIPIKQGAGSSAIRLGLSHALQQRGYSVAQFNPLKDSKISSQTLQSFFIENRQQDLLEIIMQEFDKVRNSADFIIIEGMYSYLEQGHELSWFSPYISWFNSSITRALMGYVVLVTRVIGNNTELLTENINLAISDIDKDLILGAIVTKVGAPIDKDGNIIFSFLDETQSDTQKITLTKQNIHDLPIFQSSINLLGTTHWNTNMSQPRVCDLMKVLGIQLHNIGADTSRRVRRITLCSRGVNNLIEDLQPGTLFITSIDRADIVLACSLAETKGIKLAGMILTADYELPHETLRFCFENNPRNKLPIYANQDYRKTVSFIMQLSSLELNYVPSDDPERIELIKTTIAESIDIEPIINKLNSDVTKKMSPAAFRFMLIRKAQAAKRTIVLPEGDEIRTLRAGIHCQDKGIANCILIGNFDKIHQLAEVNDLQIPSEMKILDPMDIADAYVEQLVELRKSKSMTSEQALDILRNDVNYLGAMMIYNNEAHGMVSGAENTTAATVRPALQIIKTKPNSALVSSIFFMCMEEQVLVYGDCAINPDPNAEELADIAIQSADTAAQFNIEPRVAMISYSTGNSGTGKDVEKVKLATQIVKEKRPDILIDGPLQYDAAMNVEVGSKKAPNSPVAGRATVCIFPDLNTGNTTYKAVQRSANVLSVGPLLQGLNKPVNDLSRGATVDDIIYTIAITAIQT